jgi:hypothetical protein
MVTKSGYGKKDGSQKGALHGGSGRNQTAVCRHPKIYKKGKQ